MRLLNRLLPMLALIGALSVLGSALAWLIHADAPMPGEVRVLVNAGQDGASDTRLIARPGAEPTLNASLDFDMPASRQGPWVLWLPREPLQSILVTGKDAQGRPWTSAPDGFFTPSPSDGFAPAGYAVVLPHGLVGAQRFHVSIRAGLQAAPTPRLIAIDGALRLTAREMVFASALYAAWATLLIASLALYWAVRDVLFLAHAAYTLMALVFMAVLQGHLYAMPGMGVVAAMGMRGFWLAVLLFNLCSLWLVLQFVDARGSRARLVRRLPMLLPVVALPIVLAFTPQPAAMAALQVAAPLAWMLSAPASILAMLDGARRGIPMALAAATLLIALLLAAVAHIAMNRGLLVDGMLVRHGYQVVLVLFSLVLFVGLSSRIGSVRRQLDDETSARRDSEARLRHEQVRTRLTQSLQQVMREVPEDRIAHAAFRLLGAHAGELLGTEDALVLGDDYLGDGKLFVQATAKTTTTARAVQAARALVRDHARNREPVEVRLGAGRRSDDPGDGNYLIVPLRVPAPGWAALVAPVRRMLAAEDKAALVQMARTTVEQADAAHAAFLLRRTAERDALTGGFNRRTLDQLAARECKIACNRKPLGVLFIDLDWFKRINDTHGHPCGDECLRKVAATLRAELRPQDVFGRYGGEEFLVLLPGQDAASARLVGERLREAVEAAVVDWQGEALRFTISIGMAVLREGDDPGKLLARADKALYRAKREGRNRVCAAPAYVD
ncbi:diguanylate cyclase [Thermomonas sp.]|uniref:diguanylate cyclase n=1 Tax=Thermomonas sp. TaxID=1971895 RepID=UPI0035AE6669